VVYVLWAEFSSFHPITCVKSPVFYHPAWAVLKVLHHDMFVELDCHVVITENRCWSSSSNSSINGDVSFITARLQDWH